MIQSIYDEMWDKFSVAMTQNQYALDPYLLDGNNDDRRGITALAYLGLNNQKVCHEISCFQKHVRHLEPHQYYHPADELHLTVLSIISCFDGFKLTDINIGQYIDIFNQVMAESDPITIHYRGVTASPNCIVIQGFPIDSNLERLRNNLRHRFKRSGLQSSIDARYKLVTAHSSVIRFSSPLQNRHQLLALCQQYRDYDFGHIEFHSFELVFNNWYQNLAVTKALAQCSVPH
ncbi:hypothetical protein [Celerinatantimonas yamalensis]|uniref:Mutarotase n=1 Tax=Celerinatantimonas yamalensis TaxID=559956 RepID=A0ABW9G858_9GAMM